MTDLHAQTGTATDGDRPLTRGEKARFIVAFVIAAAVVATAAVSMYRAWDDFGHGTAAKSSLQSAWTAVRTASTVEYTFEGRAPETVAEIEQLAGRDLDVLEVTIHEVDAGLCFQTGTGRHTYSMSERDLDLVRGACA